MKKLIFPTLAIAALALISMTTINTTTEEQPAASTQYRVITSVESIVPNGLGRSRIISSNENRDYTEFTTTRSEDKEKNEKNKSKRDEIRVREFDETKLLNFYNIGGIRFQNIAANDAVISSKINAMVADGWELAFVAPGVESAGGKGDNNGIFITRYIFKKKLSINTFKAGYLNTLPFLFKTFSFDDLLILRELP